MQLSQRVIGLAKAHAVSAFAQLVQHMLSESESEIRRRLATTSDQNSHRAHASALYTLREQRHRVADQLQVFFRDYLERAMQTMYKDLRRHFFDVSIDSLTLIDDETINRQIEVDRLVVRVRDAARENLGRINLIIAQIHDEHDIKERENPFRPYLLARALHEAINALVRDEPAAKVLFDTLAGAMLDRVPAYYAGLAEIFESNGVHSRLVVRPGMSGRTPIRPHSVDAQSLAELLKIFAAGRGSGAANHEAGEFDVSAATQDQAGLRGFLEHMLRNDALAAEPGNADRQPAAADEQPASFRSSEQLLALLAEQQKAAAAGQDSAIAQNRLFALRKSLDDTNSSKQERATVEVVALLFESILNDERIPLAFRSEIGRLQMPILKAALLTPDMLRQEKHPVREFVNRLGTIGAAFNTVRESDRETGTEIHQIVSDLLNGFDSDVSQFADASERLNRGLVERLRSTDSQALCLDAMCRAEQASIALTVLKQAVNDALLPLDIDRRVVTFVEQLWSCVLAKAYADSKDAASSRSAADFGVYCETLAELIWSVQPKTTGHERTQLVRLLGDLAKRLKSGLQSLHLSDGQVSAALDQLVEIHMSVLRAAGSGASTRGGMSLDKAKQLLASALDPQSFENWKEDSLVPVSPVLLKVAILDRQADAEYHVDDSPLPAMASDKAVLALLQLGGGVELLSGENYVPAKITSVSPHRMLFAFTCGERSTPVIFSVTTLLKALREEKIRLLEEMPLFDRAIDSLIESADQLGGIVQR